MNENNHVYLIETFTDGAWKPTVAVGLTQESADRKMAEWKKALGDDRKFRVVKYKSVIGGLVMSAFAVAAIVGGLTGWASETSRGLTEPGYYEQHHISLTDKAVGYDHWINQVQRKKERGR
jgi:hypothetical protein